VSLTSGVIGFAERVPLPDFVVRAAVHQLCSRTAARLIMQVHDELVLEVAEEAVEATVGELRQHMVQAAELSVPLKVDVGIGLNWDEAH